MTIKQYSFPQDYELFQKFMFLLVVLGEENFISWSNFKISVFLWGGSSTVSISSMHSPRNKLTYFYSFRASDKQFFCGLPNTPRSAHHRCQSYSTSHFKVSSKTDGMQIETVWKCSCINSFPGQCPHKMKTRKYMSIIQRITWFSWYNLLYGFHSLSHVFSLRAGAANSFL